MAKNKKTKAIKEVKKRWVNIVAPELFNKAYLGESLVSDPKTMLRRCIIVNLMEITKNIKLQNINIKFKVEDVKDNEAKTEVVGYEVSSASIKRMVRRNVEKIDDSFLVSTSDGKYLRVKPLILTRSNTKDSVKRVLRKEARNHLIKEIANMTYETFVKNLVTNRIQHGLGDRLNKIYPLRIATIRKFLVVANIKGKKIPKADESIVVPKEEEELAPEEEAEAGEDSSEKVPEEFEDEDMEDSDEKEKETKVSKPRKNTENSE